MPNIGIGELLLILVLGLIIFGPTKLPEMGRSFGRAMREFRRASAEVRAELSIDDEPEVVPNPYRRPTAVPDEPTPDEAAPEPRAEP